MLRRPILLSLLLLVVVSACGVESDGDGGKCPEGLSPAPDLPSLCGRPTDDGIFTGSGGGPGVGGMLNLGSGGFTSPSSGGAGFGSGGRPSVATGGSAPGSGGGPSAGGASSAGGGAALGGEGGESM